jgi:predicted CopG family antitoxin
MTHITIDISEEVYKKLEEKKKDNETISNVIERVLDLRDESKKDIRKAFGLWKDLPKEILEIMETAHKEMREEIKRRFF